MAQSGRKKPTAPGSGSGGAKAKNTGKNKASSSIAAARGNSGNRTQLLIGGAAIVVIIAIVVVGVMIASKKTEVQGAGYGTSVLTTASVDDQGNITVTNGSAPLSLDVYEDALCPACAQFEHQFGEQIAKAMDDGKLAVRYRMVDFLNGASASGDYSSRAMAALLAVAKGDGDKPGLFMKFHTALYDPENQPHEVGAGGTSDLSNAELASLAGSVGASEETQKQISDGAEVSAAQTAAQANYTAMQDAAARAGDSRPGTPTVAKDGVRINTGSTDWLTQILPAEGASDAVKPSASN